jgi:hypothetical protein
MFVGRIVKISLAAKKDKRPAITMVLDSIVRSMSVSCRM